MPSVRPHVRRSASAAATPRFITTPKELAARMARLAQRMRDTVTQTLAGNRPSPLLIDLRKAYTAARMSDWAEPGNTEHFADLFAQVLVYGFFAARQFQSRSTKMAIPLSDPFLHRLFAAITDSEWDRQPDACWFAPLRHLFDHIDLDAILNSLGEGCQRLDPVDSFYETFLATYNPQLRKACGVYCTPAPIVSFIIRAVDDLLKRCFGLLAGLADDEVPPRVFLLDPACGTGNFLSSAIGHLRSCFLRRRNRQTWSSYLRSSVLPRLHGFEMLPAPYAIAHLQLGKRLAGHDLTADPLHERCLHEFASEERLGMHLARSLEDVAEQAEQLLASFQHQPAETNTDAQRHLPILVVVGNPPYRGISYPGSHRITRLLEDYRQVNGVGLGEKKVWLKNDYVQFLRLGQWCIERTGRGILGFITDHSYLDSPTFRGMRYHLLQTFDEIYVLNLHGNAKRRERATDGSRDENVFAIRQGVAIALFVKKGNEKKTVCRVCYEGLRGSRQAKLDHLAVNRVQTIRWKRVVPALPGFELVPVDRKVRAEYQQCWPLRDVFAPRRDREIFPLGSNGVQTSRDHLVVGFSKSELRERLESFLAPDKTDAAVREEFFGDKSLGHYPPGDTRQWQLGEARRSLRQTPSWHRAIIPYLYRPFDQRYLLDVDAMIDWPRLEVMRHLRQANYALCIGRAGLVASGTWDLVFCVNTLCDHNLFYRGSSVNFPLYLYAHGERPERLHPNLSARFMERILTSHPLRWVADRPGDLRRTIGPENLLHYAYAVLHAPAYRRRYADLLKYDFPRLPLTASTELLRALCTRGEQLVGLHLLEKCPLTRARYPIQGDDTVRQVCYREADAAAPRGRVWINATQYFEGVSPEVWQFHIGGYPVCQKWLKDRKGRRLSHQDQACYARIVGAVTESIRLTREIDAIIEEHGGWPIHGTQR